MGVRSLILPSVRLTTAEILYRLPDHPAVLQTFVWQTYDTAPEFPRVRAFLDFWTRSLDGALHSVTLVHTGAGGARWCFADDAFTIH